MEIKVQRFRERDLEAMGVFGWPVWEKEASTFGWRYDSAEECYLLEGEVVVKAEDGTETRFGAGDFVSFPKGLNCTWTVIKPVKKHYSFK